MGEVRAGMKGLAGASYEACAAGGKGLDWDSRTMRETGGGCWARWGKGTDV